MWPRIARKRRGACGWPYATQEQSIAWTKQWEHAARWVQVDRLAAEDILLRLRLDMRHLDVVNEVNFLFEYEYSCFKNMHQTKFGAPPSVRNKQHFRKEQHMRGAAVFATWVECRKDWLKIPPALHFNLDGDPWEEETGDTGTDIDLGETQEPKDTRHVPLPLAEFDNVLVDDDSPPKRAKHEHGQ